MAQIVRAPDRSDSPKDTPTTLVKRKSPDVSESDVSSESDASGEGTTPSATPSATPTATPTATPSEGGATPTATPSAPSSPSAPSATPSATYPSPKRARHTPSTAFTTRDYRLEGEIDYVPPSTVGNANSAAAKGSRLVITQLVMNNFKSYYGRQIVGPFNDNFSAVIGPNGSGKSNVIDALLFVFGWKSRELRQEKVTGLIHKSSEHMPEQCSVEVHFADTVDNPEGPTTTRVPSSELVVSRHVKMLGRGRADHSTWFEVNGTRRTYREVREMLQDRGIDLTHRRFLILQGEVENIAMMKPKGEGDQAGLLEYLEDIIGTDKYVAKLNELLAKSDELRDAVLVSQSKVKASDETYRVINQERQHCFDAYTYQNLIAVNKYTLESRQLRDQQELLETKSQEFKETREQLASLQEAQAAVQEQCTQLGSTIKKLTELQKKESGEMRALQSELKKTSGELAKATALANQSETRKTKLEKEAVGAQQIIDSTATWLETFEGDMQRLDTTIQGTRESLEKDEAELDKLRGALAESIKPLTAEISNKQAEAEPWRVQIQTKQNELGSLRQNLEDSGARVSEAKTKLEKFKADLQTKANEAKDAKHRVKEYESKLELHRQELKALVPEHEDIKKELPALQDAARQSHAAYSQAADSSKNAQSQSNIAVKLQQFASENNLEGYYGRLGNLGAIDAKYDVAISTACPRLDQFVTQDIATAEKCIKFLRTSGIGRATFMALDKLRGDPSRSNVRPCEKVSRLIDLIEPRDPKFVKAFYFATGDTVVAKDINQARRVAYESNPRLKTVTLKGDVIAVSGAMSGGGRPSSGKMGSSNQSAGTSPGELAKLRKAMEEDEYALSSAEKKYREVGDRLEQAQANIAHLEPKLAAEEQVLEEARATLHERNEIKRQLRASAEAVEEQEAGKRAGTEREIKSTEKELKSLESRSAALEAQIQRLREQVLEKGGVELRMLDSKVMDQRTRIKELVRQQTDKESEKAAQAQRLEKARSSEKNARRALEKLLVDLEGALERTAQLKTEEARLEAQLPDFERKLAEYVDQMDSSKEELSTLKEEISNSARERQQLEKTAEDLGKQCQGLERKVHAIRGALAGIKLEDMTPYIDLREVHADPDYEAPVYGLKELGDDELRALGGDEIKRLQGEIKEAQEKLAALVYSVDCLSEYRRVFFEWKERKDELDGLRHEFNGVNEEHAKITERRRTEFLEGLRVIKRYLKTMYRMITTDGNADLELRDTNDPFEGVEFTVMPPGKSWKNISNLSGGEKTLSSLALVFALHKYKPTPLYVMDEIDAALDFKNVSIIANYIREETRHGQFVVISLRNNMFELASRLIGIYKYQDCTHSVAYDPPAPF